MNIRICYNSTIQTKNNNAPVSLNSVNTNSQSLPGDIKHKMENSFEADFSNVAIYKNSTSAQKLGALAYTQGDSIHFAPKQFDTATKNGQELIGHELTHVLQQRRGSVANPNIQKKESYVNNSPLLEKEADDLGKIAASGSKALVKEKAGGIQKKSLTHDERIELRRITGNRIDKSYTDFIDAAEQVKSDIHAAVQAKEDFIFFVADIALGYLLPGAGKALAKMANKISTSASNPQFKAAFALLTEAKISSHLSTATKVGTKALKDNYKKLTEIDELDQFIAKLKTQTRDGFDQTDANLPNLTDEQLASTYLAFKTELTNASTYKAKIKKTVERFRSQVQKIGDSSTTNTTYPQSQTRFQTGVMWLEYQPKKWVLSKIKIMNKRTLGGSQSTQMFFEEMIDKDMGPLARQAGKSKQSKGIQDLTLLQQTLMKQFGLLHNFPTYFPPGKYYFVSV
ncbi:MAG: DUF4157 domain-containing protein [Marinirhabdus sp.]